MLETRFTLGLIEVCYLNILIIAVSFFLAYIAKKIIYRSVKRYLTSANIHLEGRKNNLAETIKSKRLCIGGLHFDQMFQHQ